MRQPYCYKKERLSEGNAMQGTYGRYGKRELIYE